MSNDMPFKQYKADAFYLVEGADLILLRYALHSLIEDIKVDHLSEERLLDRLQIIKNLLPDDPPEAF